MIRLLLAIGIAVAASGCLYIPEIPHYSNEFPTRRNIADVPRRFPKPGSTTLEEVVLTLGEPDLIVSKPNLRFSYLWTMVEGTVVVAVPTPMGAAGGSKSIPVTYRLVIEFNAAGIVSAVPADPRPAPEAEP
jgi:hypothetical protein